MPLLVDVRTAAPGEGLALDVVQGLSLKHRVHRVFRFSLQRHLIKKLLGGLNCEIIRWCLQTD